MAKWHTFLICCSIGTLWGGGVALAADSESVRLDVNDISFLWPPPRNQNDVDELLSANDSLQGGDETVWPQSAFDAVLEKAQSIVVANSAGRENRITFGRFEDAFKNRKTWKVAGVRIDPSAPGTAPMVTKALGSIPQIRLIVQPVTVSDSGEVTVHDVAAHLVFNFVERFEPPADGSGPPRAIPDKVAFGAIVADLVALKVALQDAGVTTAGKLTVHPRFQSSSDFESKLKDFLKKHLAENRLSAVAFMGIESPEPWIFFAMRNADGALALAPQRTLGGNSSQMLTFRGGTHVMPPPTTSNVEGGGVSTAVLFTAGVESLLDQPAVEGADRPRVRDIPDIIANPQLANFANTDCVSCHSESARRKELNLGLAEESLRFRAPEGVSGLDDALLPQNRWNVRNFGWFPRGGEVAATATVRTANEAAESADYINREYLQK